MMQGEFSLLSMAAQRLSDPTFHRFLFVCLFVLYDMGRSYPQVVRENVLDLHNNALSIREIGAQARVSNGFITKVPKEYNERNYSIPQKALCGRKKSILTEKRSILP